MPTYYAYDSDENEYEFEASNLVDAQIRVNTYAEQVNALHKAAFGKELNLSFEPIEDYEEEPEEEFEEYEEESPTESEWIDAANLYAAEVAKLSDNAHASESATPLRHPTGALNGTQAFAAYAAELERLSG